MTVLVTKGQREIHGIESQTNVLVTLIPVTFPQYRGFIAKPSISNEIDPAHVQVSLGLESVTLSWGISGRVGPQCHTASWAWCGQNHRLVSYVVQEGLWEGPGFPALLGMCLY